MSNLADLRPGQVSGYTKAVLPIGATEGHGPHLPAGTDTYIAEGIAKDLQSAFDDMLLLPTLSYGVSDNHMMFPFTLSIQPETMISILDDLMESLFKRKIYHVIIINGHNGNTAPIEIACRRAHQRHKELKVVSMPAWWLCVDKLVPESVLSRENGWHAGETETALSLAYFPQLIDMTLAEDCWPKVPYSPLMDIKYTIDEMGRVGSVGYPSRGTVEKGNAIREALKKESVRFIRELDQMNWEYSI